MSNLYKTIGVGTLGLISAVGLGASAYAQAEDPTLVEQLTDSLSSGYSDLIDISIQGIVIVMGFAFAVVGFFMVVRAGWRWAKRAFRG